jgi:uncharacterized secreted protein with C-terminal beta-propeller domain
MAMRRSRRRSPIQSPESLESRRVLSVAPLIVRGDADPALPDDVIVVESDPAAPAWMQVTVNGAVVARKPVNQPGHVVIEAGAGDDVIRVDVPSRRGLFTIRGGDGDDHITVVGNGRNIIQGGAGHDTLVGGEGVNRIHGDAGDDIVVGGPGRDLLVGGAGADRIFGHRAKDRIRADVSDTVEQTRQTNPLVRAGSLDDVGRWLASGASRVVQSGVLRGVAALGREMAGGVTGMATTNLATTGMVAAAPGDHSGTNNQVSGVEEGDLVQTDGRFIYLVGDGRLRIIDAAVDHLAVVGQMPVPVDTGELFLHGDRLTVVSTVWAPIDDDVGSQPGNDGEGGASPAVIDTVTDAADGAAGDTDAAAPTDPAIAPVVVERWIYQPQAPEVRVTVIDVGDPAAPAVVEEMAIDGVLVAARSIGDRIHLVIDGSSVLATPLGGGGLLPLVMPMVMPMVSAAITGVADAADVAVADSSGRLPSGAAVSIAPQPRPAVPKPADLAAALPSVRVTTPDGGTTTSPLIDAGDVYMPLRGGTDGLFSIVTFSPVDDVPGVDHTVTTLGLAGVVQASADTLVIASTDYDAAWRPMTVLNTFALGAEVTYLATGSVAGWVPDQFAIDAAADGRLRVVVNEGWRQQAVTVVHVLERQGLDLRPIGRVGGIAPGEDLKAVRFLGDTAYVVTFEEVDPLFAIDLANPRRPRVAGELKIPGFSSYLQTMEPGRLFGIGRGAEPGSSQVSLFDISDMRSPREVDTAPVVEGEGWSHSEAAHEHRAFSWFPRQRLLAVPFSKWNWNGVESTVDEGLRVLGVDRDTGFTHVADLRHDGYPVRRSLRIGETLYSVSSVGVMAHDMADSLRTVASLRFG